MVFLCAAPASAQYLTTGVFWDVYASSVRIGDADILEGFGVPPLTGDLVVRRHDDHAKIRVGDWGSYGQNWIACDRARGTFAAPQPLLNWDVFCSVVGVGYDGSDSFQHGPEMQFRATEDWTPTAHGSQITLFSVARGSTYQVPTLRLVEGRVTLPWIGSTPPVGDLRYACIDANNTLVASSAPCVP